MGRGNAIRQGWSDPQRSEDTALFNGVIATRHLKPQFGEGEGMRCIAHSMSFPIYQYETGTTYVSCLTWYCGLTSPNDLCLDQGFGWQDFVRGDDFLFDKMAAIGGANAQDMKRWGGVPLI